MSVFPKETIKNIGESLGVTHLKDEVASALAQDVEYRVHELIQEATKFMRHSKRSKLTVDDVNAALRVKNVEPLYGYACGETPTFRKTTVNGQELYFAEDEEVDFETILAKPLPKIPLDATFTAHWLAIEGVQPAIPQNPTPSDAKADLLTKRAKPNAAINGITTDQVDVKPLVKHVLSKELQMYFERITEAVSSPDERLKSQAFESLRMDPGLHQLLPYFVQHIHKKVTQNHKQLDVLEAMLSMAQALLNNKHLFVEPYLHQLIPPILSCLVGRTICESPFEDHWSTRHRAAGLMTLICNQFGKAYHTLQPRITKTLLRALLDPARPLTTHYGAIVGLDQLGPEVTRVLVAPNIKFYAETCLKSALVSSSPIRKLEAQKCKEALVNVLIHIAKQASLVPKESDMQVDTAPLSEEDKAELVDAVGEDVGKAFLESDPTRQGVQSVVEAATHMNE
ncbi:TATA box binding protein associated factor [Phycomyces blakesleeanus]|uniref:TBP-associated factor 6 n=1 Tax=Phycomyces blakesleeanus (strain ATCC 8743b / DSM 1359 / FGSC 10004 / NBRC 33097 / NRRL 1555) TaxID=763407 RepID=A0A162NAF9_PHYB8|nr:TATA box binding protein associated factor [Phycomyces blakesleeanus NRRL 1555(-)]OAD67324.1 TATA box binding protein associated factor [Phycomyces blakesleeanus NRRL 1555(-)]|eukprot:XP_018285364.1 TATA box binding protein associated factor [Phycomyces blakesleeanus NRRL 1555(-)]